MPDDSNQTNNQSNNQSNNQAGTSSGASYSGGGKKICLGADNGCRQEDCTNIQKGLEDCGNTVKFTCIDPNQESHMKGSGCDFNVFFCNGVPPATMWSFRQVIKSGGLPFTIFAFITGPPYHDPNEPNGTLASMQTIRAEPFEPEHDAGQFMDGSSNSSMASEKTSTPTLGEWVDQNSQYVALCSGNTAQELAQNICSGACGGGSGTGGNSQGGGAAIKDKTFEACIRRICAATDSIFIVENNAAILFPYTDWMAFTLREKINSIEATDVDPDIHSFEYNNEGTYNKVTATWGGEELPEREFGVKKKDDKPEVKNFGQLPLQKSNTQITKNEKTTTTETNNEDGSVALSEQYNALVDIYGELEKRVELNAPNRETAQYIINALLIQYIREFNNTSHLRTLSQRKYIGGTFYNVTNPLTNKSELQYLHGYTTRIQKDEPLYIDSDFRYGPEGAEEILDYQHFGGGGGGAQTSASSSSEEQIWADAAKCKWAQDQPDCSTNDPATAKKHYDEYTAKGQEVHFDCFGMSAYLYYRFNNEAHIPAHVIGSTDHKVIELYKNNQWYKPIEEYRRLDHLFHYDGPTSSPNSPVLLEAPNMNGNRNTGTGGNTG